MIMRTAAASCCGVFIHGPSCDAAGRVGRLLCRFVADQPIVVMAAEQQRFAINAGIVVGFVVLIEQLCQH